ncbi:MAG: ParB/RepB/Spo0J family partition protein [Oscillospiraceae bacterium]|nr:ParB/RepB/Spo0J family partition protein [Oscillospiraceae bacterium]
MPKKLPALNLPPADSLFSTQADRDDAKREKVQEIPLTEIDPFPEHPFQVKQDESMMAMAESVKAFDVQTPAIVRRKDDGRYELVSGHRRRLACELEGLDTLPCIIRDMTHDEAIIAMVDANLQREVILPSEKARSYKMKLDAMKRQGRCDSAPVLLLKLYSGLVIPFFILLLFGASYIIGMLLLTIVGIEEEYGIYFCKRSRREMGDHRSPRTSAMRTRPHCWCI